MDDLPPQHKQVRIIWRDGRPLVEAFAVMTPDFEAEYARLDTLPAVRWTPGAPPEDMRDGRKLLIWVRGGGCDIVMWRGKNWSGYDYRDADILAWADPQPPEGV